MARRSTKTRCSPTALLVAIAGFTLTLLAGCAGSQLVASREPLHLTAPEREHMRAGMRAFLESVEGITQGVAENNRQAVARSAKRSGWSMMDATAAATALKLPPEFVAVSIDTHQKFDDLAAEASSGAPKAKLLQGLGQILNNCTSCHAAYRLAP